MGGDVWRHILKDVTSKKAEGGSSATKFPELQNWERPEVWQRDRGNYGQ